MADRIELSAELMTKIGWYYNAVMAMGFIALGVDAIIVSIFTNLSIVSFAGSCCLFFGALYLLRWKWTSGLKRIEIAGDALYMSDYLGRQGAVHLGNVADVGETGVFALKRIELRFDVDTRFGRIVQFRPKGWRTSAWRPQPIATFLKERVASARVGVQPTLTTPAQQYGELQAAMTRLRKTEDQAHSADANA
ncbi:MAG TPA: hypothetical protein VOA87_15145 [Thermoanaerobaculia bacterium]|nr:hypothetical protein [Thermoanaerobaculia bacterium]